MKGNFKIWDKVVFNRHWYTNKEKEWLLYTTIDSIDVYDWEIKYFSKWGQLFTEWLRLCNKEEMKIYFIY